jgi:hypothetical protein
MSGAPTPLGDLLAECDAHDIRLLLADDGGLTIDAPQDALTPELLGRLKAHKGELLTLLLRASDFSVDNAPEAGPAPIIDPATNTEQICRCGSTTSRDVPIHDGQSTRRDCGRCGRFIEFPIWHGNATGHNGQYTIR